MEEADLRSCCRLIPCTKCLLQMGASGALWCTLQLCFNLLQSFWIAADYESILNSRWDWWGDLTQKHAPDINRSINIEKTTVLGSLLTYTAFPHLICNNTFFSSSSYNNNIVPKDLFVVSCLNHLFMITSGLYHWKPSSGSSQNTRMKGLIKCSCSISEWFGEWLECRKSLSVSK